MGCRVLFGSELHDTEKCVSLTDGEKITMQQIARRKCVWRPDLPSCERCQRLRQRCYESSNSASEHEYGDCSEELKSGIDVQKLYTQVSELYAGSEKLQSDIYDLWHMEQNARYIQDTDGMDDENEYAAKEKQWDLIAINGIVTVKTPIRSIPELFDYCRWSLHYLSAFAGVLDQDSIYFESVGESLVHKAYQSVPRTFAEKQEKEERAKALQIPVRLDYRFFIDQLIEDHVLRQTPRSPFIHVPTFIEHYRALKDPLNDPVTMALCVTATMRSTHLLNGYTIFQRRQIAEYFYRRCRLLLSDMFDDPSRRMETIVTITILYYYMILVKFRFHEARRLSTISYLLCNDLVNEYKDPSVPLHQRTLFQRHYFFTLMVLQALEFSLEGMVKIGLPRDIPQLVLPTEAEAGAEHLIYYHYLQFLLSPQINIFWEQMHKMVKKERGTYRLEAILHYRQNIVAGWWGRLPDSLRLCDDPFSADALDKVDKCTCNTKLLLFALLHEATMTTHCTLLKPSQNGHAFMDTLKEYIVTTVIRSAECLIYSLHRMTIPENIIFFLRPNSAFTIFVDKAHRCIHIPNYSEIFYEWLERSLSITLPKDHCAPCSSSSVAAIFQADNANIAPETYEDHPLPGYAFFHDLIENSMQYLPSTKL